MTSPMCFQRTQFTDIQPTVVRPKHMTELIYVRERKCERKRAMAMTFEKINQGRNHRHYLGKQTQIT